MILTLLNSRLPQVEIRSLSTSGKVNRAALKDADRAAAQESGEVAQSVLEHAAKRRNDTKTVDEAKARYLARKKAKRSGPVV